MAHSGSTPAEPRARRSRCPWRSPSAPPLSSVRVQIREPLLERIENETQKAMNWSLWLIDNRDVPPHAAECIAVALSIAVWDSPLRLVAFAARRSAALAKIEKLESQIGILRTLLRRIAAVVLRRRIRCNQEMFLGTRLRRFAAQDSAFSCDDLPQ